MIAEDAGFRQSAWLVKNGVPFGAAFGLPPGEPGTLDEEERMALAIILTEHNGEQVFDWNTGRFRPREGR